jgi:hypothetical protein
MGFYLCFRTRFGIAEDEKNGRCGMLVPERCIPGGNVYIQHPHPAVVKYLVMPGFLAHLHLGGTHLPQYQTSHPNDDPHFLIKITNLQFHPDYL